MNIVSCVYRAGNTELVSNSKGHNTIRIEIYSGDHSCIQEMLYIRAVFKFRGRKLLLNCKDFTDGKADLSLLFY